MRTAATAMLLCLAAACARASPEPPAPPAPERDMPPADAEGTVNASPELDEAGDPGLRELCEREPEEAEDVVEQSRRVLAETFCGATLWFDGLFGDEPDVASARETSGRVEVSTLVSEFGGVDLDGRLRLRYELPNLERRVDLLLGRGDPDEMVEDREEGFAIRSASSGVEAARAWLAGLALAAPGDWADRAEFRAGVDVSTSPELFVQGRVRQERRTGERTLWRFRETLFWKQHEGVGITASVDYDRLISPVLILRWNTIGTLSEASEGVVWRSATVLYRGLGRERAVAGEVFARGATSADVPLGEYGGRAVYRHPLRRPYLFGELVVGYSWPRSDPLRPREGSLALGIGTELRFGTRPVR